MKFTLDGLIAFIMSQPADTKIDHTTWGTGAVSKYAYHAAQVTTENVWKIVVQPLWEQCSHTNDRHIRNSYGVTLTEHPCLMDMLNHNVFDTYGEAQAWLMVNRATAV